MKYLVALAALSASTVALADDPTPDIVDDEPANVQYEARQVVDFDKEVSVTGAVVGPSGSTTFVRRRASFNPMIQLRANFTPEMRASIDEVK